MEEITNTKEKSSWLNKWIEKNPIKAIISMFMIAAMVVAGGRTYGIFKTKNAIMEYINFYKSIETEEDLKVVCVLQVQKVNDFLGGNFGWGGWDSICPSISPDIDSWLYIKNVSSFRIKNINGLSYRINTDGPIIAMHRNKVSLASKLDGTNFFGKDKHKYIYWQKTNLSEILGR